MASRLMKNFWRGQMLRLDQPGICLARATSGAWPISRLPIKSWQRREEFIVAYVSIWTILLMHSTLRWQRPGMCRRILSCPGIVITVMIGLTISGSKGAAT